MMEPAMAANAAGVPQDPVSHHIDEARYSVGVAADLCASFAMACASLSADQKKGMLAIHRVIHDRLDFAYATLEVAYVRTVELEARQ